VGYGRAEKAIHHYAQEMAEFARPGYYKNNCAAHILPLRGQQVTELAPRAGDGPLGIGCAVQPRYCTAAGKGERLPRRDDCNSISSLNDDTLLAKVKGGDPAAFAWLYERHVTAALQYARSCHVDEQAAHDLVTESFTRVLGALRRGRGPETALGPYLAATMRSVAYERSRVDGPPTCAGQATSYGGEIFDPARNPECELIRRAFASLPPRWQFVLWRTVVEGEPAAAVGLDLGLSPRAAAALTRQARAALDGAYLREHCHAYVCAHMRMDLLATWWAQRRRLIAGVHGWTIANPRRWLLGHLRQWENASKRQAKTRRPGRPGSQAPSGTPSPPR